MAKERISGTQIAMLLFMTILPTIVLFVPGILAHGAKQSAWLVTLFIPLFFGIITLIIFIKLEKRFPRHSLPQYAELILGKFLGKGIGILYIGLFIFINFLIIREFSEFIVMTLMPHTPIPFLNIVIMVFVIYATWKGIEVIARTAQFVFPLFLLSLIIDLILPIPEMKLGFLLPILEEGIKPLIFASLTPAAWFGETIILAFLLPFVNKTSEVKSKGIIVVILIAIIMSLETLITISVLGPELTASFYVPFWELSRYIEYGNYVQRLETLLTALWIASIMLKVALFNYLLCLTTQQVFNLKSFKFIILPLAIIQVFLATFTISTTQELIQWIDKVWPPIAMVFELGIPLLLLVISFIRKKSLKAGTAMAAGRGKNDESS